MSEIRKAHAVYDLIYHIVLVTKYRRPVLTGKISEELKAECSRLIEGMEGSVLETETDRDHVHILAELSPRRSVTDVINILKGVTARIIRRDFGGELQNMLWEGSLWSSSYYVATAGGVTPETLKQYVHSQPTEEHKRKYVRSGKYSKSGGRKRRKTDSATP